MSWAIGAREPLLERSAELARIEAALGEARTAATEAGMCVLRSRGTELESEFAFGVVRQLVEPALAETSEAERAELLQAAAGVAATLLGLPGALPAETSLSSTVDPSFAI